MNADPDEPRLVVSASDMTDEAFAYHLALRHPGMRAIGAPEPTRGGHAIAHYDNEHAHVHARRRRHHE
jgi:hypothetical protein